VIWIVLTVVRGSNAATSERGANPERILAERFAAGEIDEDEYHQRLATLRDVGPAGRVGGPR
jgi:putative membrane protein